ncbi:MAG: FecR family protein [Fuerstiella sp.]|nr:FecR family protein [Fuerstiella sp.]
MNESQLQKLLEDFQDDALNEAECRELMAWFDEDDSRVAEFADELRVGNALVSLHMMDSDHIPLAVRDSLQKADLASDISRKVRQRIESRAQPLLGDVELSKQLLTKWTSLWLVTAAVIALFFFLPTQQDTDIRDVIATVQNARNFNEISTGDALRTGQVLTLVNGRVKINFQSGARLAVQGPAELKLLGPNSAQLRRGVATVRVPGEIKGFLLVTPHQRVTDLGTSFGVDVDITGNTAISVFEGEIELEDHQRLVGGQAVAVTAMDETAHEVPYAIGQFLDTWQVSFGVEQLIGDVRVASPSERHSPGLAEDSGSLLLFPEREDVHLMHGFVVDGIEPGTYQRPFRKNTVKLTEDMQVDSFLVQYNPVRGDSGVVNQKFQGELHFDRPIVALILQTELLESSDAKLALPATEFRNIFRRGINDADMVALSPDRRVLRVTLNIKNGVDQIRVLVANDNNLKSQ